MTPFKGIKWIVLFVWLISAFLHHHYAQNNIQQINVHALNINSKDGLPTNYVNCIFKDHLGFYWLGTQAGLCRYDGYKIYLYKNNPKDSFSLKCSNILSITQYKHYLIIACEKGIVFFDYYKNKFLENKIIDKKLKNTTVYSTYLLSHKLYMAGETGLYEYNFQDSSLYQYSHLSFSSESKFLYTPKHFLLCDVNTGIRKIDTIHHVLKDSLTYTHDKPIDIIQYGNNLYIFYSSYGIVKADVVTLEKIQDVLLFKDIFKNKISGQHSLVQLKNKLYFNNDNQIIEFDPLKAEIKFLNIEKENSSIKIRQLFNIDNNLVVTTAANGIYIIPISIQKIFNPFPEYIHSKLAGMYSITEYRPGKLLIGGEKKLLLFNILTNTIEKDYSPLFKNGTIMQTLPLPNNEVVIATYGSGIFLLNTEQNKLKPLVKKGDFLCLYLNDDDTLWAGTVGEGLWKANIKTGKYTSMKFFENQTINHIKKINQKFYIATSTGLYIMQPNGKIILHLNEENKKLSNNWVYHFSEDTNYMYIATDNGLTIYNKKDSSSKFFYDTDGLPSNVVLSVYTDKNNNLWLQTMKGIAKMILNRLNNPNLKLLYNYSYLEGLINYEFNQNAHALLKNNYLVYGGTSGLDIFNPLKIRQSFNSIPIYITSFKKSGKEYTTDTNIIFKRFFELDWRQNNFQIEVTAINPLDAEKTLYKYKLEGYDDEYSEPSTVRYISYTGLPGGIYKLNILATNQDGEWNTSPYYIYIKVTPPFWKTPWFIISASILVFGSIFGFNQYRTYQIKKRNKELEEKVKERTKELANKNQEILSSIEYAKRIQQAILPTNQYIQSVLPNAFILYMPKDIVSGDFYWVYELPVKHESEKSVIVAAVDCTGHGVPGALMSMIGSNLLNQIVIEKNIPHPEKILQEMNKGVQTALKQGQSDIKTNDGMDASIARIFKNGKIQWAGAYRPLVIITVRGEIIKIEGDKYPIGGVQMDADRNYTLHTFDLQKGDSVYLFSDGYADQFGGDKGKKMMMKRFLQLLQEIHLKPLDEQKEILKTFFNQWKSHHEQVDDVLVIGTTQV
ncbi:MAG: hypothetical protein KatS3mg028_0715 [Bacteroidia bacterium]|nr:MAG: hypothetical protein KatS3mg028_0715 [Bacteroidia bacterium]